MTPKPLVVHPAALAELEAATEWYRARSERAFEGFLKEIDKTIEQIARDPSRFAPFDFGTRRALLRRFPYVIVFRQTPSQLEIVAVAHGRRRPGYWRERTR